VSFITKGIKTKLNHPIRNAKKTSLWDSQQISRFESLKKGPKIVAILITFILWRVRKKQVTSIGK
jgi:hypothetical protein